MVEQRTHKPLVGSSNLPFGTILVIKPLERSGGFFVNWTLEGAYLNCLGSIKCGVSCPEGTQLPPPTLRVGFAISALSRCVCPLAPFFTTKAFRVIGRLFSCQHFLGGSFELPRQVQMLLRSPRGHPPQSPYASLRARAISALSHCVCPLAPFLFDRVSLIISLSGSLALQY